MEQTKLIDNHGRPLTYLRLAVTDRCNLRCFYCMPESGIKFLPREEMLSFEEIQRLVHLLSSLGVNKVRITGGEPFIKKDLIHLLEKLSEEDIELHITTNGVLTKPYLPKLKELGVKSINLSLDCLDKELFSAITRRDEFETVMECFHDIIAHDIPLKINMVVMKDNLSQIIPMARLIEKYPVSVRFIEEMPFNGSDGFKPSLSNTEILACLQNEFASLSSQKFNDGDTANIFRVPGMPGNIGIIAAYARTFCGSCNRIRITAKGQLKTCLYDNGVLDLKKIMVEGGTDEDLKNALQGAFNNKAINGHVAEKRAVPSESRESMSTIGG